MVSRLDVSGSIYLAWSRFSVGCGYICTSSWCCPYVLRLMAGFLGISSTILANWASLPLVNFGVYSTTQFIDAIK